MRIFLKNISNMCVRALCVSPLLAMNSLERLCRFGKHQCYAKPSYISLEGKETLTEEGLRNNQFGGTEGWILEIRVRLPRDSRKLETAAIIRDRVPNSPTSQVLGVGPDFSVQVDVYDWTRLTRVVRSGRA